MYRVFPFKLWKNYQIFASDGFLDAFLKRGIDQSHTAPFESGTGEAAAINTIRSRHNLVEGLQLG